MAIGIVQFAQPVAGDVMPWHLARSFSRSDTHFVDRNEYVNGEVQVRAATTISRKVWNMELPLLAAQLDELRAYFDAHQGGTIPFYFYDVLETVNYAYDVTGVSVTGLYTVRFNSPFDAAMGLGTLRAAVPTSLIELA